MMEFLRVVLILVNKLRCRDFLALALNADVFAILSLKNKINVRQSL